MNKNFLTKRRNAARMLVLRLLMVVERLNEFRTGKPCIAKVNFMWNIGIGYHCRVEENALVEFYVFPFTLVSITNFNLGATVSTVNAANVTTSP